MALYKTYSYKIPIFYVPIKIMVGITLKDIMRSRLFSKEDREEHADSAALAFVYNGCIYIAIPVQDEDLPYMVHEIVHAKNFLYKMRGIMPDTNNDENEAYLVQYIYSKCMDARRKFVNFVSKQRDNASTTQQGAGSSRPGGQGQQKDSDPDGGD